MVKQIWKFPLKGRETEMPVGAHILTVQMQNGTACLWALVDIEAKTETRYFSIVGTGHNTKVAPKDYIGTFQDGSLVWHLFEGINIERSAPAS